MRAGAKIDMSYQALNLVIHLAMDNQFACQGKPLKPLFKKKGRKRMSEFLAFMGGALFGVALMCCLQINRLADHRK